MAFRNLLLSLIITTLIISGVICENCNVTTTKGLDLFDFTKSDDVEEWVEQSDTVRSVGTSKATIVLDQNTEFRRAVLFVLLNPQSDGSAFAGVRVISSYNLTEYAGLQICCRGQGKYHGYKIVLRHKGLSNDPYYTFEQYFEAPNDEFNVRTLLFSDFELYYRGQLVNTNTTLDTSQITSIGIQMYGGVYLPIKQKGPATLEINWLQAV